MGVDPTGPLRCMVVAELLAKILLGITVSVSIGKLRITLPRILFLGIPVNAFTMSNTSQLAGHVMVHTCSPGATAHVQGSNFSASGHCALYIIPSTRNETRLGRIGKFVGGLAALGLLTHWFRNIPFNLLKSAKKL